MIKLETYKNYKIHYNKRAKYPYIAISGESTYVDTTLADLKKHIDYRRLYPKGR